jgi:hypothetical protein
MRQVIDFMVPGGGLEPPRPDKGLRVLSPFLVVLHAAAISCKWRHKLPTMWALRGLQVSHRNASLRTKFRYKPPPAQRPSFSSIPCPTGSRLSGKSSSIVCQQTRRFVERLAAWS